ncbi:MAG: S8 family serine peptidase [Bacteroidota bacterium]
MKKMKFGILLIGVLATIIIGCKEESALSPSSKSNKNARIGAGNIGINVLIKGAINQTILKELNVIGKVQKVFYEINALTMLVRSEDLSKIQSLSYVNIANPDTEVKGAPVDAVPIADFSGGLNTWDLDAVNVTDLGVGRTEAMNGSGVYVAVLDTGLPDSWRQYFPQERIATEYAKSFGGGGGENENVSEQPNKWEHDQNSHGGHVTSTIIGYKIGNSYINGVAPMAKIIPVKVLNQNGSGWGSVVANGIIYVANLKAGPLANSPVVINMSLGGSVLDAIESAAIDYAISKGVIIVASAGNSGTAGMGYPGGYAPVISVAATGWIDQFSTPDAWITGNVPDPSNADDVWIAPFSSRELPGQDLDVAAPGVYTVGPYQINSGQLSYYYLSGTSMASPHVAGIVALMAQKKPNLTAAEAETILETAAIPLGAGARNVTNFGSFSWGVDASGHGFITADAALAGTP